MPLSAREDDVLRQILQGATSREAGEALGLSPRTIDVHVAHILRKCGVPSRAKLIARCRDGWPVADLDAAPSSAVEVCPFCGPDCSSLTHPMPPQSVPDRDVAPPPTVEAAAL